MERVGSRRRRLARAHRRPRLRRAARVRASAPAGSPAGLERRRPERARAPTCSLRVRVRDGRGGRRRGVRGAGPGTSGVPGPAPGAQAPTGVPPPRRCRSAAATRGVSPGGRGATAAEDGRSKATGPVGPPAPIRAGLARSACGELALSAGTGRGHRRGPRVRPTRNKPCRHHRQGLSTSLVRLPVPPVPGRVLVSAVGLCGPGRPTQPGTLWPGLCVCARARARHFVTLTTQNL